MQSLENDRAVSHPSHSHLENADTTGVSHIPTATATAIDLFSMQEQSQKHAAWSFTPKHGFVLIQVNVLRTWKGLTLHPFQGGVNRKAGKQLSTLLE